MSDRDATCESRIHERLYSREEQFNAMFNPSELDDAKVIEVYRDRHYLSDEAAVIVTMVETGRGAELREDEGDTFDDAYAELVEELRRELQDETDEGQAIDEAVLAVSTRVTMRIELSTGGPGDWIDAQLDGRDVEAVTYHFNDWFDHAERRVEQSSPLWALAEYYAQGIEMPGESDRF